MRTFIDQEVMVLLDEEEQFVVPRLSVRGYVRVDSATVKFSSTRKPSVFVGGIICRKDGGFRKGSGRISVSVQLSDELEALVIENARRLLATEPELDRD